MTITTDYIIELLVTGIISFLIGLCVDYFRKNISNRLQSNIKGTWRSSYFLVTHWYDEIAYIEKHFSKWRISSTSGEYVATITKVEGPYLLGYWKTTSNESIVRKPGVFLLFVSEEYIYGVATERDNNDNEILVPWCLSLIVHDINKKITTRDAFPDEMMSNAKRKSRELLRLLTDKRCWS